MLTSVLCSVLLACTNQTALQEAVKTYVINFIILQHLLKALFKQGANDIENASSSGVRNCEKGTMFKVWSVFALEHPLVLWLVRLMNAPGFQLQSRRKESC